MDIKIQDIINIAKQASEEILKIYEKDFKIETKTDERNFKSPLTEADTKSNTIITNFLKNKYPQIPIISEENKEVPYEIRKDWTEFWLIDPIDGTKGFVNRNGEFTVNIALIKNNVPYLGVVHIPTKNETYYSDGERSYKIENNLTKEIRVRTITNKIVLVASKNHLNDETQDYINSLKNKYNEVDFISTGSSLKLCLVAEGKADLYPRLGPTMEWDIGAAHAVVRTAGGRVLQYHTDYEVTYNKEDLHNPYFIVRK